ncbi:hypothetical protein [Deinococcus sp. SL84]|uniref:hypothetical protein n=1 Tax=Deinococcus sp. SL84 TaxID=2994663 RepID=UPI002DD444A3|nr:hypothetical protein [Deinococcus sp. SL84]
MSDDSAIRRKLKALATALRQFHSALLDKAREDHEFMYGPVGSPYEMFNLVTSHPNFQWLRPLSGLMATLDEVLDTKDLTLTGQQVRDVRQALDVAVFADRAGFRRVPKGLRRCQGAACCGSGRRPLARGPRFAVQPERLNVCA